jgi:hypothetical protein
MNQVGLRDVPNTGPKISLKEIFRPSGHTRDQMTDTGGDPNVKFEQGIRRLARQLHLPPAELELVTASLATLKHTRAIAQAAKDTARTLDAGEAVAYRRAVQRRYQDAPCGCGLCQAASVTDRPLRFVPTLTRDGDEVKVWCPPIPRLVIAGHWAHGVELARWYAARDIFFRQAPGVGALITRRMAKAALTETATPQEQSA